MKLYIRPLFLLVLSGSFSYCASIFVPTPIVIWFSIMSMLFGLGAFVDFMDIFTGRNK